MTATTHAVGHGRPLHSHPFFEMLTVRLVSYRQVWRTKDDYVYECTWSDGEVTTEGTLPWGNLGDLGVSGYPLGSEGDMAYHRQHGQQVPRDHATPPA